MRVSALGLESLMQQRYVTVFLNCSGCTKDAETQRKWFSFERLERNEEMGGKLVRRSSASGAAEGKAYEFRFLDTLLSKSQDFLL